MCLMILCRWEKATETNQGNSLVSRLDHAWAIVETLFTRYVITT